MEFPFYIPLGSWQLHPHLVFEALAYVVGFQVYRVSRRRRGDTIPGNTRWTIIAAAAAAVGALVGSKLLAWLNEPRGRIEAVINASRMNSFLVLTTAEKQILSQDQITDPTQ